MLPTKPERRGGLVVELPDLSVLPSEPLPGQVALPGIVRKELAREHATGYDDGATERTDHDLPDRAEQG